jgi:hypothetical protein
VPVLSRLVRRSMSVAAALVVTLGTAGAAQAHPFGDPQTARISIDAGDSRIVHVDWKPGALDDLALLRDFLELPGRRTSYDDGLPSLTESAQAARELADAPELARYLLERVSVTSVGATCVGSARPVESLAGHGAGLDFTCPAPVESAAVTVRTLTDLDPAYRTLATGPGSQRAVYDIDHETREWSATASAAAVSTGRSAALQLSLTGAAIAALVTLVLTVRRRRAGRESA